MATSALAIRMKFRNYSAEKLQAIINNSESTELEIKIAKENLAKLVPEMAATENEKTESAPATVETPKKAVPKKKVVDVEPTPKEEPMVETPAEEEGTTAPEAEENIQLTKDEEERLTEAEKAFDERKKKAKRESKVKKVENAAGTAERVTKRENLETSTEVPGLKVGSKVTIKNGGDAVGEIVRLYKSSDGKEKVMIKFGDDKPIKKRVNVCTLV